MKENGKTESDFMDAREKQRLYEMYTFERAYLADGLSAIAGVDEAGRGPLAGPVVACAVILPAFCELPGVDDSKKLTPKKREAWFEMIMRVAKGVGIGVTDRDDIDAFNILNAATMAMNKALKALSIKPDIVLVDGNPVKGLVYPHQAIVGGDGKSATIAAASIVAKVTRDRIMDAYDKQYPGYGFAKHKGYGTQAHMEAIRKIGLCPIHRRTFCRKIQGETHES